MPKSARPLIRTFPTHDDAFGRHVRRVAKRERPEHPEALAALLRADFPSVHAHERDPMGTIENDPTVVWYVFRDGGATERDAS